MAETVTLIFPWPGFQAVKNGQPLIGGKLYTYQAETSTPKAAYLDSGFVTPQTNPIVLDDQGRAEIWLNGYYHLRLTDAEDVLLWDIASFTFETGIAPPPGEIIMGSTDATVSVVAGTGQISVPGLASAGYRIHGVTWTITEDFGTSSGLTAVVLGDSLLVDRWGAPPALVAGTTGGQLGFHSGDEPVTAPAGYVILVSALGGNFDTQGEIHLTCFWSSLPADVP
jgi:hypothetical protein